MKNIDGIINQVRLSIRRHELENGYARWLWQNKERTRELGNNPYGCADAANLLYMIGDFSSDVEWRMKWIQMLQNFQNPETGLFYEETHHPYHTTAHCVAALELFDATASYPLIDMYPLLEKAELERFLDQLHWKEEPWIASHQGAGIYAALVLMGVVDTKWENWYFDWLYQQSDEKTGLWRSGMVNPTLKGDSFSGIRTTPSLFPHLAGTFHYLFNHEYAHRKLRYPEKLIDTCLSIYQNEEWETLGSNITFAEIDWVYCLNRATRQCPHRFEQAKEALYNFAHFYINHIEAMDYENHDGFQDLHTLFGCVCALAELQSALPGEIITKKPLKLVLDRRPFI